MVIVQLQMFLNKCLWFKGIFNLDVEEFVRLYDIIGYLTDVLSTQGKGQLQIMLSL